MLDCCMKVGCLVGVRALSSQARRVPCTSRQSACEQQGSSVPDEPPSGDAHNSLYHAADSSGGAAHAIQFLSTREHPSRPSRNVCMRATHSSGRSLPCRFQSSRSYANDTLLDCQWKPRSQIWSHRGSRDAEVDIDILLRPARHPLEQYSPPVLHQHPPPRKHPESASRMNALSCRLLCAP